MKVPAVRMTEFLYYKFYKPVGVISQMLRDRDQKKKQDLRHIYPFPEGVQAIGRLDEDSEGLLLLTNDREFNHRTLQVLKLEKEYWVQVVGEVPDEHIEQLRQGVNIQVEGVSYQTQPCKVLRLTEPLPVVPRIPHLLRNQKKPWTWLSITIKEGKNRQVRRMTAALGYPTVRLIRVRIGDLKLDGMQPGEVEQIEPSW
jgi:23S rRNA pseudouridine2457 synthase